MNIQRTIVSASLALALTAILAAFYCVEYFSVPPDEASATEQSEPVVRKFHELDRLELAPTPKGVYGCLDECHTPAPHVSDMQTRAFLNMHSRAMDCSVCHLKGKLVYKALPKPDVEPIELLLTATLDGAGDPKLAHYEVEQESGKHLVDSPIKFQPEGIGCKRCHRRGSTLLRALGNYAGHRKRILEDLEILSLIKAKK